MFKNLLLTFAMLFAISMSVEAQNAQKNMSQRVSPTQQEASRLNTPNQVRIERAVQQLRQGRNTTPSTSNLPRAAMAPLQWQQAPSQSTHALSSATVDVELVSVTYPISNSVLCGGTFVPRITIKNNGATNISTLQINTYINNATTPAYSNLYGGTVTAGVSVILDLVAHTIPTDVGTTLKFEISQVNGGADPNPSNNSKTVTNVLGHSFRPLPYMENFDGSVLDGISTYNFDNDAFQWQLATGISGYGVGTYSAHFDNYGYSGTSSWIAPSGTEDWMVLPPVNLSNAISPSLKFDIAYKGYVELGTYYGDTLVILVSTDCFENYDIIYYNGGANLSCQSGANAFMEDPFIPTANDWCTRTYTLANYVGNPNVSIAFINLAEASNKLYIDNINISNACSVTASTSNVVNVTCNGGNNGAITANPANGTAPYTYRWSNGQTSQTATGLIAGAYTVTVTDANACSATATNNISQPATAVTASVSNVIATGCGVSTGGFTVNANGGVAPYTYQTATGVLNSNVLTGLGLGVHSVTITDANGCIATVAGTITSTTPINLSVTNTAVTCAGNDGTATATVSNGTSPYTYLWSNGATTSAINTLAVGAYTVTVTDAANCQAVASTTIINGCSSCSINVNISSTPETCFGFSNGSILVTPTTGSAPYTYAWSYPNVSGNNPNNLDPGTYSVTVTDAQGCTATQSAVVTQGAVMVVNIAIQNNGSSALATPQGGTAPYTYLWSDASTQSTVAPNASGAYSVTVTDANGCTVSSAVVNLIVGIEEVQGLNAFSVYPNPNDGVFTVNVDLAQTQNVTLVVSDVLGRQIQSLEFNQNTIITPINLTQMPSGIYFVTLQTATGRITEKVVKF